MPQNNTITNTPWQGIINPTATFRKAFHKPVLAVDWNSTIQNQISEICRTTRGLLVPEDFDRWDPPLGHKIGMSETQFTRWAWSSKYIKWRARPYANAKQALASIRQSYQVWVVTFTCLERPLVERWFSREGIGYDRLIITGDKGSVPWNVLIDDNPETLAKLHRDGRLVIRFAVPKWNSHLVSVPAIHDWADAEWMVNYVSR